MNGSLLVLFLLILPGPADAPKAAAIARQPMHPKLRLLDRDGKPVIESGRPVSTLRTCGNCHDTEYISAHSYHSLAGADRPFKPGEAPSGRPWDRSGGLSGRWDPMSYGPVGATADLKDWVRWAAGRHVGGGPAQAVGVEMDCFLCHFPAPDHQAREQELRAGRFEWATTATLSQTGVVKKSESGWTWNKGAFDAAGECTDSFPRPRSTTSANCGMCHGVVHDGSSPLVLARGPHNLSAEAKGQVFSAELLKNSGLNLEGKEELARPFDVHAERLLRCADCHSTINNPAQFSGVARETPRHLAFEPRRVSPSEYLARPNHHLARGHTPQGTVSRELDGTMRRCEHCHNAESSHQWLPYTSRHFQALNCEACHVPRVYAPAREQNDWTVAGKVEGVSAKYRGSEGDPSPPTTLLHGFQPVLLPREELDGSLKLTPHNLITSWYWVGGDPPRPVSRELVRKAFLEGDDFVPAVKALLDGDRDGVVSPDELRLDTPEKAAAIQARLEALGVEKPRIQGEIQPYSLHHGVATGTWAVRSCAECHGQDSRVSAPMELAAYVPGGVLPKLVGDANVRWDGAMSVDRAGRLTYQPATAKVPLHVIGLDRWKPGDLAGLMAVSGALLAVFVHGGLRVRAARKGR